MRNEQGVAAIFTGHVEAQPGIELVADTDTEERRALDAFMFDDEIVVLEGLGGNVADHRVGGPDEAL